MGTEAVWVPLVLSAVSAGATYVNQRNTAKRQDNELAAQLRGQASKQHEADAKTAQLIAGEAKSSPIEERQKISADFGRSLAAKAPQASTALTVPGGASAAYEKAGSDAQLGITKYGKDRSDLLADMDAPFAQRLDDQIKRGRYSTDANQIGRFNRGDTFLSNMRLSNIKGNPKLALLSSLAATGARATAGGGGGGGFGTAEWEKAPNLTNNLPELFDYSAAPASGFSYMRPPEKSMFSY